MQPADCALTAGAEKYMPSATNEATKSIAQTTGFMVVVQAFVLAGLSWAGDRGWEVEQRAIY